MNVDYGNSQQRTPCVLVLDASGSMSSKGANGRTRIDTLNEGIRALEQHLKSDDRALSSVQISIVAVGGPANTAAVLMDWTDAINFVATPLMTGGATPLGAGLILALDIIESNKRKLRSEGIGLTRPWLMVLSDGVPTDDSNTWANAVSQCRSAEKNNKVQIYPIGVADADLGILSSLSEKGALRLDEVKFGELFEWLSDSLISASKSRPEDIIQLPAIGWTQTKV